MLVLLIIYSVIIMLASIGGGLVPLRMRLSHRRMQIALSFVSGVMLGMAMLHLLPHAWLELKESNPQSASLDTLVLWLIGGFLTIFLLERFFCFHHHEPPHLDADDSQAHEHATCTHFPPQSPNHQITQSPNHEHRLSWAGAAIGLSVHSILAGIALAASVRAEFAAENWLPLAGFGTFLIIFLHKPFDSFTIGTLMASGERHTRNRRHLVNALFALAIPIGIVLFEIGFNTWAGDTHFFIAAALAFSAGMFLCVALSDLLPELQFHHHDRIPLSLALIAGIALAFVIGIFEGGEHGHDHGSNSDTEVVNEHGHDHDH